jgi:phosphate transport system substrate-binding protein
MNRTQHSYRATFIFLLIMLSGVACNGPGSHETSENTELKGTITISGAWALYPITVKWAEEFRMLHPQVRIDISAGGAGKGFTDAITGMVDLGMFSRGFSQAELDKGIWFVGVTKDAVIPVVNENNPFLADILTQGVTQGKFQSIYLHGNINSWKELLGIQSDEGIHVFTRSDACGAAEMWAEYLGKHQENLLGTGVFGDPGIASAVKNDPFGMGYNNVNFVYDLQTRRPYPGLVVIPLDLNQNGKIDPEEDFYRSLDELNAAIRDGIYPAPPARPLYFVAKSKPERREVTEFLRWILEKGQEFVDEAGYVALPGQVIEEELKKLN